MFSLIAQHPEHNISNQIEKFGESLGVDEGDAVGVAFG
jgi:hypothetical protein